MIHKRDFEQMRRKTVMSEALHQATTSPYQAIRQNAEQKLKFLQEEYKGIFGEYSQEHVIKIEENSLEIQWEVNSAKRSDGYVFNIDDTYKDANGNTHTIKRMWIADNGRLMADAVEGGSIDLFNVHVDKYIGDDEK